MAALLSQVNGYEFKTHNFNVIKEKPLIYWWDDAFLKLYAETPKLGDETDVKQGMATANNTRFLRYPWEIKQNELFICSVDDDLSELPQSKWVPYIKGAEGQVWFEPLSDVLRWNPNALEIKLVERDGKQSSRPQNEGYYFRFGIAFTSTGSICLARCPLISKCL